MQAVNNALNVPGLQYEMQGFEEFWVLGLRLLGLWP